MPYIGLISQNLGSRRVESYRGNSIITCKVYEYDINLSQICRFIFVQVSKRGKSDEGIVFGFVGPP
jgi:hypothetical protein